MTKTDFIIWMKKYYKKGSHSLTDYEEIKHIYQDDPDYCKIINWTVEFLKI